MRRSIRRHPEVETDIIDIGRYIARTSRHRAIEFFEQVEMTLKWLLRHPGAGGLRFFDHPELAAVRSFHVGRFRNHLVLYQVIPTGIYVLAISQGARDLPPLLQTRQRS